jgi:hypothetical protein
VTEPEQGRPILLVLDASAIQAYGAHETVGQIIGDVDDDGGWVALPSACLAEALASGVDPAMLELLRGHLACREVTSTSDWEALGRFMNLTRSADGLHDLADSDVTMLAVRNGAYILTDHPARYTAIFSGVPSIQLEEPWKD